MEQRPYQIRTDPARKLMTINFDRVFWDVSVADRFKAECLAAVDLLRCPPGTHVVLVDLRTAVLQGQDVYERMQMLVGSATAARIALVASAPLARMQTKRLQIRDNIVMFADLPEAQDWLFSAPEGVRAAA